MPRTKMIGSRSRSGMEDAAAKTTISDVRPRLRLQIDKFGESCGKQLRHRQQLARRAAMERLFSFQEPDEPEAYWNGGSDDDIPRGVGEELTHPRSRIGSVGLSEGGGETAKPTPLIPGGGPE